MLRPQDEVRVTKEVVPLPKKQIREGCPLTWAPPIQPRVHRPSVPIPTQKPEPSIGSPYCGWLRNPFRATFLKPWFLMIPLQIPTNHGFKYGFQADATSGLRPSVSSFFPPSPGRGPSFHHVARCTGHGGLLPGQPGLHQGPVGGQNRPQEHEQSIRRSQRHAQHGHPRRQARPKDVTRHPQGGPIKTLRTSPDMSEDMPRRHTHTPTQKNTHLHDSQREKTAKLQVVVIEWSCSSSG